MNLPVTVEPEVLVLDNLRQQAREYAENARSANTQRAYETDLRMFREWCEARGLTALPATPETLSLYVADVAKAVKPSTLQRRLSAISVAHRSAGYDSPLDHAVVKAVLRGARRATAVAQTQKEALSVDDLRRMVAGIGAERRRDIRDRALLLVGFAGALRRSELVGLSTANVRFEREGMTLTLRRSKTNQEGALEVSVC